MNDNKIGMTITQEQVDAVIGYLKNIEEALPGLIDLTPEQRKSMAHYCDKDLAFIIKAFAIAGQHPEILPPSIDLEAMRRDLNTLQKLDIILHLFTNVIGKLQDSRFSAGSQSQGAGRSIYQFVKTHNALTGELEDAVEELGKRYAHKSTPNDKPGGEA